ncbi:hypothetical protein [Paraglaciecola sp. 20A4]|uniref:hypothetical protein n=1 Tax=Paraglaciecola sp. 20A4 TaxID=2687288 RepID=UPI00140B9F18|nr:hypothetical protein [Paraglaciecola sp. 20A4]
MDIVTKNERLFFKLLPVVAPIILVVIFGVLSYFWYVSKSALTPFETILTNNKSTVILCGNITLEKTPVQIAFKNLEYTKISGTHPIDFYKLSVESGVNKSEVSLGQDSNDKSMFWLYSKTSKIKGFTLGYIKSEYLKDNVGQCS